MGKVIWKGSALTAPVPPVLITCSNEGKSNIFTVAWTGIICTRPPMTYISVRPERYSYGLIKSSGEFAVNLTTSEMAETTDFCGVRSGRDVNKYEVFGIETEPASEISVPVLCQSPVSLECKVREIVSLGTHDMFIADIVAVDVNEECIDKTGRLDLDNSKLLAYAHGTYFELGRKLGTFGYSVKKTKKKRFKPGGKSIQ